jgi:hypothetical protein
MKKGTGAPIGQITQSTLITSKGVKFNAKQFERPGLS